MIFLFLFLLRVREISAGRSNYPFRGLLTPSPVFMLPTAVHIYVYVDTQFTNSASSYSFTMGSRSSSERDLRLPLRWSLGLVKRKSLNFDIQVGVFLQESSLIVHRGDKWRCNRCGTYRQTNKRTTREDSATQSMDTGGLVPQHMIEESFRSSADGAVIASRFLRASSGRLVIGKIGRDQKNVEISSQDWDQSEKRYSSSGKLGDLSRMGDVHLSWKCNLSAIMFGIWFKLFTFLDTNGKENCFLIVSQWNRLFISSFAMRYIWDTCCASACNIVKLFSLKLAKEQAIILRC